MRNSVVEVKFAMMNVVGRLPVEVEDIGGNTVMLRSNPLDHASRSRVSILDGGSRGLDAATGFCYYSLLFKFI